MVSNTTESDTRYVSIEYGKHLGQKTLQIVEKKQIECNHLFAG